MRRMARPNRMRISSGIEVHLDDQVDVSVLSTQLMLYSDRAGRLFEAWHGEGTPNRCGDSSTDDLAYDEPALDGFTSLTARNTSQCCRRIITFSLPALHKRPEMVSFV